MSFSTQKISRSHSDPIPDSKSSSEYSNNDPCLEVAQLLVYKALKDTPRTPRSLAESGKLVEDATRSFLKKEYQETFQICTAYLNKFQGSKEVPQMLDLRVQADLAGKLSPNLKSAEEDLNRLILMSENLQQKIKGIKQRSKLYTEQGRHNLAKLDVAWLRENNALDILTITEINIASLQRVQNSIQH